jgi:NAD(P)-dependent dehydrogenase (short-subunit alcohol dehydrogenase family)
VTHTDLSGVLGALVTPFTPDGGEIDAGALEAHVERLIQEGVHGLLPGGSTGEFTTLSLDERKQLTELVVKAAGGRVPVVAGTGALSTRDAIDLTSRSAHRGDDAEHLAYGAAKGGLLALTKGIARGFDADGVLADAVAPGWVGTELAAGELDRTCSPARRWAR